MRAALFGRRSRMPLPFMDELDPTGQGQGPAGVMPPEPAPVPPPQRPGMFGGRARGILRREDGDPGTFANYLLFGSNGVQGMRDSAMNQQLFGAQMRGRKLEEQQAQQEQAAREAAIAALPEHLRPLAPLLTPDAISRAVMPEEPDWEIDPRTGRPYTIEGGSIRYGQGNITPAGTGAGERAPPAGYRWTADGNLEAVPGGPADIRATEAGQSRIAQMDSSERSLQNAIDVLRGAESQVTGSTAGVGGQILRGVGGTAAYDLNQALEPVRAILSFENLQEMRRNSQTGGALGSIAVRELELLGSTVRSLDTAQSPAALRRAIMETRAQLERTQRAIRAARAEMAPPSPSASSGETRERTWNPETGRLE